jgi:phosphoglycolate phosphatase
VSAVSHLVLFDIDGTLVQTLGAGVRAMGQAFDQLYNRPDALRGVRVAGRTDRAIVSDAFARIGVDGTLPRIRALSEAYFDRLPAELARAEGHGFGVLPGVARVLGWMEAHPEFSVALLTGNFETGAAIKLRHFDLWSRFAFGAFGDAHLDRRDLVPVALAHAQRAGLDVPMSRVIVIGDTPLDVDCAHAHGAVAVAVATGNYTVADLKQTGAELVLGSLEECDPAGAWLADLG